MISVRLDLYSAKKFSELYAIPGRGNFIKIRYFLVPKLSEAFKQINPGQFRANVGKSMEKYIIKKN